ncbi:MAG: DUF4837 family protein [Alistipes sp.]|nr:DUF4837 family protein [Alistipes sp.]
MKRVFISLLPILGALTMFVGCKSFYDLSSADNATGTPYELVLVCAQPEWQSGLGDTLQAILKQPVKELMQYEPMYNVMRILPNNFKSLTERHRNIVIVNVDPSISEPGAVVKYDVTAKPQIYITLQGPDTQSLTKYVSDNRDNILYVLEKAERDRTINYASKYFSVPLREEILDKFGLDLAVANNYQLRTSSDDMIWISQEFPMASQGFFIYKYPYEGKESLTAEALVKARNRFASRIPGPADGSYMSTVSKIPDESGEDYIPFVPEYRTLLIGDRPWIEMVGLWDVENYFMGGPYVSYTTLNKATNEVVTIDCYVYYPKTKKRNMLRELQHLVYLANFPTTQNQQATE